jgi:hypothetical protein
VVALRKLVDLADARRAQRGLELGLVELLADASDVLRGVKIEMHLPRGRQRQVDGGRLRE